MDSVFIAGLLAAAVRIAAPLIMGALGGLISERAGVFAVGIEGMMLAGAFGAAVATFTSGNATVGLVAAISGWRRHCVIGRRRRDMVSIRPDGYGARDQHPRFWPHWVSDPGSYGGHPPTIRINLFGAIPVPFLSRLPIVGRILSSSPS